EPHVGDRSSRAVDDGTPHLRSLHLAHITATNVHASAGHVFGLPEAPLCDLSLHDVSITFADAPRAAAPEMAAGVGERSRSGLELGIVTDGELSRVRVHGADVPSELTSACTHLVLIEWGWVVQHD